MSRTIRRKNSYLSRDHIGTVDDVDSWDKRHYGVSDPAKVVQKKKARFHGDYHRGSWNAPSWYARMLNKKVSRQNRQEIHRCLKLDCWDDHAPIQYIRNANWNWW